MTLYIDSLVSEGLLDHKSHRTQTLITTVSAGTVTLTVSSEEIQILQGSISGQIMKLPSGLTLTQGYQYQFNNDSTQNVTIQDGSGASILLLAPTYRAFFVLTDATSIAGAWSIFTVPKTPATTEQFLVTYPGTGLTVNYTGGNVHFNATFYNVAGGAIALPDSTTNGWIYVTTSGVVAATASLPSSTGTVGVVPLYKFTTTGGAVTQLVDERQDDESNLVWGTIGQISSITYNGSTAAGTLDVYARADHVHGANLPLYAAGSVAAGSFSGPGNLTAAVTLSPAFPSTNYAVTVTGTDGRSWVVTNIATTGFIINAQAKAALSGPCFWQAILNGQSS